MEKIIKWKLNEGEKEKKFQKNEKHKKTLTMKKREEKEKRKISTRKTRKIYKNRNRQITAYKESNNQNGRWTLWSNRRMRQKNITKYTDNKLQINHTLTQIHKALRDDKKKTEKIMMNKKK